MKTKQPAAQRRGYINAKHTAEGQRVKAQKQAAYKAAEEYKELSRSDNPVDVLGSLASAYQNRGKMKAALEAEASHGRMRRVRYGDK